ncbi:MAG: O-antigen ligase family protein, partial [Weeksellaceae bacterium]|nr:O-antigen ligase family protein [Weeksellaceae bacterium]
MNLVQYKFFSNAYQLAFFMLGLFPIVPFAAKPFLIVPLLLVSVLGVFFRLPRETDWKMLLVNSGIYLIFLISLLNSKDGEHAANLMIRLLPFLAFPLAFALIPPEFYEKSSRLFFRVFTICCVLFCLLIFVYVQWLPSDEIGYIYSHISKKFWGYREHPIYISLYLGIALIILLYYFKKNVYNIALSGLLLFTLFFLSRKGNLISLALVGMLVLYYYKSRIFTKQAAGYLLIFIGVLVGAVIIFDNNIFNRFQEIFIMRDWYDLSTSTGIRNMMLKTCIELSFESPFFGYGLADVQDVINDRLVAKGHEELIFPHEYNAHNQYLQFIMSTGYTGLILFLGILCYNFRRHLNVVSKIGLYVFLYICLCFAFESLLERQNGIIIVALFLNLYAFKPRNENNHH